MGEPFVYVGTWTIKEGKEEEWRKYAAEHIDFVETNEPRVIGFYVFGDEDGKTATIVHVHPDSESMEFHMKANAAHFTTFFDIADEITSEQYYGPMSDALSTELAKWDDPNVAVTKRPGYQGGFTRTSVR